MYNVEFVGRCDSCGARIRWEQGHQRIGRSDRPRKFRITCVCGRSHTLTVTSAATPTKELPDADTDTNAAE